jgi:hypothetical protein
MGDNVWTLKMIIVLSLVIIIGLGGCAPPTLEPLPTPTPYDLTNLPEGAVALTWKTIKLSARGSYQYERPALIIVASPEDTAVLESLVEPDVWNVIKDVDFDTEFVLVAFQGRKGSSGYQVEVRAMVRQGTDVSIHAYFITPRPGQAVAAVETSPYHAIRVRKEGEWGNEFIFILYDNDKPVAQVKHFVP